MSIDVAGLALLTSCSASSKAAQDTTTLAAGTQSADTTGAPTTAAPTGPPDPCKLVTVDQVSKLVQVQVQPGVNVGKGDDLMCQYLAPPDGPTAQVEIFTGGGAHKSFQIDHDTLGHDFTELDGIGDEAWLEADNVYLRKGSNWAQVNVVALDVDEAQIMSGLKEMAATIAKGL
jgi:hypothetical protein